MKYKGKEINLVKVRDDMYDLMIGGYYIIGFYPDGKCLLHRNIDSKATGLRLDKNGRIKIRKK